MKKSSRLLIALVAIEAVLFGIGAWLIDGLNSGALQPANNEQETAQTIFSVLGSAMGLIAGVAGVAIVTMRRKGL